MPSDNLVRLENTSRQSRTLARIEDQDVRPQRPGRKRAPILQPETTERRQSWSSSGSRNGRIDRAAAR